MKLQSPTLILVFFAIALGSFVAVTELRPGRSSDEKDSQSIFSFEEEEVRSLVVETATQTLMFEKDDSPSDGPDSDSRDDDESDDGGGTEGDDGEGTEEDDAQQEEGDSQENDDQASDADADDGSDRNESETIESETIASEWWMRSPDDAPADDPTVIFLVNLMASGVSDRVFDVAPDNLDDFGFDSPLAEIEVTLENDESHRLILGNYDFNGNNIYAQTVSSRSDDVGSSDAAENDAEGDEEGDEETVEVFIVSTSFDAAVNRPLEEWKQSASDDSDDSDLDDSDSGDNDEESSESSDLEDDEQSDNS